ncbi:MAG: hypothetical protein PHC70_01420 [Patescibacteria group bacterium]|jgi:hypothetical protein|nr:hypothetical protein [Patescibacteria group bacterium]
MLIKERLPIPIERHESGTLKWFVGIGIFLFVCLALQDYARLNFGLDVFQLMMELGMVSVIVFLPMVLMIGVSAMLWHALKLQAKDGAILVSLFLGPLAIFLISAHLFMSHALSPLKLNFRNASQLNRSEELTAIVKARDKHLEESGYHRLGTWRAGDQDGDCVSVYLFTGAF